jgi:hypothetical protein
MKRLDLLLLVVYLLLLFYLDLHSVVVIYCLGLLFGIYKSNLTSVSSVLSPKWYLHPVQ